MSVEAEFTAELGHVSRKWRLRLTGRLRHIDLTEARWQTLFHIAYSDRRLTQRELAEQLRIEGPTLVRILDGLEDRGLIERQPVAEDRRAKALVLTDAAVPVIDEMRRIAEELQHELLADVSRDELAIATSVLQRIREKLER